MNRLIAWFASNGIAANLLMALIIVGGLLTIPRLKQEVFPELESDSIRVSVQYLGAAPDEVEEGICRRVEEAVYGLSGIKRITSNAQEGFGVVIVEMEPNADSRKLLEDVKTRVDAIDTFPEETERPIVEELVLRRQVIEVAVSGNTDERSLRRMAERVRDEIASLPGISLVDLASARPYEVSIEVSEDALRRHGLTFDDVARAVRQSSLDLPGGSVKTRGGEFLLRTKGQAYRGPEFESIVLISRPDGTRLSLGEVATVIDGFEDVSQSSFFDGEPAILVQVFRVGDQGALDVSATVHEYVEEAGGRFPQGISLTTWQDDAAVLRSRLDLLIVNGLQGLALVCISLALFLRLGLALWVAVGIPLSFLGAVWLLPTFDVSVNVISLFAFIVVLGLVVDDAIVIGENVFTHLQRGSPPLTAAIEGAKEVAGPVVFAVLTSVAAFSPLLGVPGRMGKVMEVIPAVVIATLIFSLVESLLILPTHLSHLRPSGEGRQRRGILATPHALWMSFQRQFANALRLFTERVYSPVLEFFLAWRYLGLATGLAILLLTVGYVAGGHIRFVFFPVVDADNVAAILVMPQGTPEATTRAAVRHLEKSVRQVLADLDEEEANSDDSSSAAEASSGERPSGIWRHVLSSVGSQPFRQGQDERHGVGSSFSGSHLGEVNVELVPSEERKIGSGKIAQLWRSAADAVPDAVSLTFTASLFSVGEPVNIQLAAASVDDLRAAAEELKTALRGFAGIEDVADSFRAGKQEVELRLRPQAEPLGVKLADLGRQVRQGFYGEEAQRIQRGRDDVRVMIRYPEEERRSLSDLESMRIRTAMGAEVDFGEVAVVEFGRGYAAIQRADRRRTINVTADVDQEKSNANEVLEEIERTTLPRLMSRYPGLTYSLEGEQREQSETYGGLARGLALALLIIYALLAIPFRSYFQPLIVMSAIPFGVVGVVFGHVAMRMPLTFLSLFGLVALTGVVVNDSLIMVDFINRARSRGGDLSDAIRSAGVARFRPILLTSLTTFAGLSPILFEKSMQAQFLIPMAASLGFGVIFATVVTLILVPVLYLILEDASRLVRRVRGAQEPPVATVGSMEEGK